MLQLKQWLGVLGLGLVLSGCGVGSKIPGNLSETDLDSMATITIGGVEVKANINLTGARESASGLSYVYSPGTEGVLYVMPIKEISYFNSYGLDKGADFIWIADVGENAIDPGQLVSTASAGIQTFKVVDIDRAVKPEVETDPQKQRLYDSSVPVNYMLEVSRDWVSDHGVRVGDEVLINNGR